jgi:Family of unknown function (DUF6069)
MGSPVPKAQTCEEHTMTYPASPDDVAPNRVRPDSGQFWAGGVATAVVAALIALVGILVCRWALGIPILAPANDGTWGDAHTGEYVLVAACVALVATGLLYLLVLATPEPGTFFRWIMALATLAAVVYPFSTSAPLEQKAATAVVNLVLGVAITSLLTGVASRAIRRSGPPRGPVQPVQPGQPGRDAGYAPGRDAGYAPGQRGYQPTQPMNGPQDPGQQQYPGSDPWR